MRKMIDKDATIKKITKKRNLAIHFPTIESKIAYLKGLDNAINAVAAMKVEESK